jgi:hypothetical protein
MVEVLTSINQALTQVATDPSGSDLITSSQKKEAELNSHAFTKE